MPFGALKINSILAVTLESSMPKMIVAFEPDKETQVQTRTELSEAQKSIAEGQGSIKETTHQIFKIDQKDYEHYLISEWVFD